MGLACSPGLWGLSSLGMEASYSSFCWPETVLAAKAAFPKASLSEGWELVPAHSPQSIGRDLMLPRPKRGCHLHGALVAGSLLLCSAPSTPAPAAL